MNRVLGQKLFIRTIFLHAEQKQISLIKEGVCGKQSRRKQRRKALHNGIMSIASNKKLNRHYFTKVIPKIFE